MWIHLTFLGNRDKKLSDQTGFRQSLDKALRRRLFRVTQVGELLHDLTLQELTTSHAKDLGLVEVHFGLDTCHFRED